MITNARYIRIVGFFAGLMVQIILWEILLRRLGFGVFANRTAQCRYSRIARQYRQLAITMGGVLIKVGQFLSSRVDVLPEYVTDELSCLQDEVPPIPFSAVHKVLSDELGEKLGTAIKYLDPHPIAAASLGQAYSAELVRGEKVIVKIQRPDIETLVRIDISALKTAAKWVKFYPVINDHANVEKLLEEFSVTLYEELDYTAERANAEHFASMYQNNPDVRIPYVYNELSTRRVLTLEDVRFIKITDFEAIEEAGIPRTEVAQRLYETYVDQIFRKHFFHADPHPGNLFVEPAGDDHNWRLVFVDFGMVGHVTPEVLKAGREAIIALATQDAERLAQSTVLCGALLPGTDVKRIVEAYKVLLDRFWGKSMEELRKTAPAEVNHVMKEFRDLLFKLPFQVPENMIYLGRCLAILSGMCTGLDPNFNLFLKIIPFAKELLEQDVKEEGWDVWLEELFMQLRKLFMMPSRFDRILKRLESGDFKIITRADIEQIGQINRLANSFNRFSVGIICATLFIAGTYLYVNGYQIPGFVGWILACVLLVWIIRNL